MNNKIRRSCVLALVLAATEVFAVGRIVQLEQTDRLDTETTEFRRIDLTGWNIVGMNLSFRFANAVSNNVEIAIVAVMSECGSLFAALLATLPTWLYDANWNLVRLTKRGPAACDVVFKIEVVSNGFLFIVN